MGARVIAAASTDEKLPCARAWRGRNHQLFDRDLRERPQGNAQRTRRDVVYDPVGCQLSEAALRSMAWRGRFLVVVLPRRHPEGAVEPALAEGLLHMSACFLGGFIARRTGAQRVRVCASWSPGSARAKLHLRVHAVYPLERAADALHDVTSRKVIGKVVLTTGTLKHGQGADRRRAGRCGASGDGAGCRQPGVQLFSGWHGVRRIFAPDATWISADLRDADATAARSNRSRTSRMSCMRRLNEQPTCCAAGAIRPTSR